MSKYIIKNCPAIYIKLRINENNELYINEYRCKHNSFVTCQECTDCLLKRIYEDVKTVYRTPEYFEELAKKGDEEQETIESCWHNVAHMVISKLDIQEVE